MNTNSNKSYSTVIWCLSNIKSIKRNINENSVVYVKPAKKVGAIRRTSNSCNQKKPLKPCNNNTNCDIKKKNSKDFEFAIKPFNIKNNVSLNPANKNYLRDLAATRNLNQPRREVY
ncbi:hypothetical protein HDU92_005543 [Lobulomyces angularis]|nr:hypothetical protein HDU92_005543 [Lobulomyces angularis]